MNKRTTEEIQILTSDLYYDLLDKYVLLKQEREQLREQYKKLKLLLCNSNIMENIDVIKATNKQIEVFIGIAGKHHCSKEYINELKRLKIKEI